MSNNYPNTAQHSHLQDYFEVVKECWDKATARKMIRKVPQMRPKIAQKIRANFDDELRNLILTGLVE